MGDHPAADLERRTPVQVTQQGHWERAACGWGRQAREQEEAEAMASRHSLTRESLVGLSPLRQGAALGAHKLCQSPAKTCPEEMGTAGTCGLCTHGRAVWSPHGGLPKGVTGRGCWKKSTRRQLPPPLRCALGGKRSSSSLPLPPFPEAPAPSQHFSWFGGLAC